MSNSASALEKRFTYHPPKPGQPEKYGRIRAAAHEFAKLLSAECPDSRELNTALTNLDATVFFANAAIARNEEVTTPRPTSVKIHQFHTESHPASLLGLLLVVLYEISTHPGVIFRHTEELPHFITTVHTTRDYVSSLEFTTKIINLKERFN